MSLLDRIRERQSELTSVQAPTPRLPQRQEADLEAEHAEADRIDYIADHVDRLRLAGQQGPAAIFILPD